MYRTVDFSPEDNTIPVKVTVIPEDVKAQLKASGMSLIKSMIEEQNSDISFINRLIALELACATEDLQNLRTDPSLQYTPQAMQQSMRVITERIKGLRELARTLSESDALSKRDALNFDGPKFQYAVRALIGFFSDAITAAGYDASARNAILKSFRTISGQREESLRRDIERLDGSAIASQTPKSEE
jgi:hypothetical protein